MKRQRRVPRATRDELRYIEEYASRPAVDRLAEGQLEVVPTDEIPEVLRSYMEPQQPGIWVELKEEDLRRLLSLSKRKRQAPGKLLARWARERLHAQTRG